MNKEILISWGTTLNKYLSFVLGAPISVVMGWLSEIRCVHPFEEYETGAKILVGVVVFALILLTFSIWNVNKRNGTPQKAILPLILIVLLVFLGPFLTVRIYESKYCLIAQDPEGIGIASEGESEAPEPESPSEINTIAITEVMCNPFSPTESAVESYRNEYIELFNYGQQPVDVGNLWISTSGETTGGDKIVSWDQRSTYQVGSALLEYSTTIIPANGIAIVLSPDYYQSRNETYRNDFNEGTIILSIAEPSNYLGEEGEGLVCSKEIDNGNPVEQADAVIVYGGDSTLVSRVVSSYGGEDLLIVDAANIDDPSTEDGFPKVISNPGGVTRACPLGPDVENNWFVYDWDSRSPGSLLVFEDCLP